MTMLFLSVEVFTAISTPKQIWQSIEMIKIQNPIVAMALIVGAIYIGNWYVET